MGFREAAVELRALIHESCNHREHACPCRCGCAVRLACDCIGPLCSVCTIRERRDDEEHGEGE
jgi:hypothetical protein